MKAFVHTQDGDYEVEAPFLRVDTTGVVATIFGRDRDEYVDERPLATVKLSDRTYILFGDEEPKKRDDGPAIGFA